MKTPQVTNEQIEQARAWKKIVIDSWVNGLNPVETKSALAVIGLTCELTLIEEMFSMMQEEANNPSIH